jgi:glycosyltransferase involved in cell wall biosynthesis
MKIAVWHNLPSGGGKRVLYYHVRGLLERGHQIEAWCPPTADASYLPLRDLVPEHTVPLSWQPAPERHAVERLFAPYRNVRAKLDAMDRHCRACAEQMSAGGYDVLFAHSCRFFRVTSIGRHVEIPRVLCLGEPYRWLYEALPELPWPALADPPRGRWSIRHLKGFLRNLVEVQGLRVQAREELVNARGFDAILVNSLFSRESVLRAYGLGAQVCYLGIDTDLFVNQQRPREGFILGLGALISEKRPDLLIDAVSHLPEPRPEIVWVGNVASLSFQERMLSRAVAAGVRFTVKVRISDKEVVDLLNRAAMLVYGPRLEPFGLAPLEAGACGLPVVAVAEGGVRETILDGVNGLLVDDNPVAIAGAIQRLLADPAYAARLGAAGCDLVARRWSLSASIDRLEKRLSEALMPDAHPRPQ